MKAYNLCNTSANSYNISDIITKWPILIDLLCAFGSLKNSDKKEGAMNYIITFDNNNNTPW